ncbi:MAG: DUF1826 domain-containing protein [Saprospirales bacterium]|nr:MAG: DUF1826 domain-containing protein [Saprospirales bacterium]
MIQEVSTGETKLTTLSKIHHPESSFVHWQRNLNIPEAEYTTLSESNLSLKTEGTTKEIRAFIESELISSSFEPYYLIEDITFLLQTFSDLAESEKIKFFLSTINNNMCRRFHTDCNELRLLCTYLGPGTLVLPEDAIDRNALHTGKDNEEIIINEDKVIYAEPEDVLILKGSLYPGKAVRAAVHRSPTIEESGAKRLLLRLDTESFGNYGL